MFEPDRITPDEYGFFYHPDLPETEEDESIVPPMAALGYECSFVQFEYDAPEELVDAYYVGETESLKEWAPTQPDGQGWLLVAKYDTEDGPWAMFVRKNIGSTAGEGGES